jgi:hypothetical protein
MKLCFECDVYDVTSDIKKSYWVTVQNSRLAGGILGGDITDFATVVLV